MSTLHPILLNLHTEYWDYHHTKKCDAPWVIEFGMNYYPPETVTTPPEVDSALDRSSNILSTRID